MEIFYFTLATLSALICLLQVKKHRKNSKPLILWQKKAPHLCEALLVNNSIEISNISFTPRDFELIIHMIEFILEFDKIY